MKISCSCSFVPPISTFDELEDSQIIGRAGIIPYVIFGNQPLFLLGTQGRREAPRITDFGGCSEEGESPWTTALRELKEESRGLVRVAKNQITDVYICRIRNRHGKSRPFQAIYYVRLDVLDANLSQIFQDKIPTANCEKEVWEINWYRTGIFSYPSHQLSISLQRLFQMRNEKRASPEYLRESNSIRGHREYASA